MVPPSIEPTGPEIVKPKGKRSRVRLLGVFTLITLFSVSVEGQDAPEKKGGWRLADSRSDYLREHAKNPVEWFEWGETAFKRAKELDRPIFLSIGYSSCHWCHVMRRESFSDEKIASYMNEHFVNIKLDREELPHVDEVYMAAVQRITGSGGWPLSVWMTPDLVPFFGGTYFPPTPRYGRRSFPELLEVIVDAWKTKREDLTNGGQRLVEMITTQRSERGEGVAPRAFIEKGIATRVGQHDARYGGFGQPPKFPAPRTHTLLTAFSLLEGRSDLKDIAVQTLREWSKGGIYDQIGGGFHRYSVDGLWAIPHFEKMLYNQGLNIEAYLDIYRMTGEQDLLEVARDALDALIRDFALEEGGFAAAWDADSEEEEGTFYLWTPAEVKAVVGAEPADLICAYFGITEAGNFEGGPRSTPSRRKTIPQVAKEYSMAHDQARRIIEEGTQKLFDARSQRIHPHRDNKVILGWNALAISALARGSVLLGHQRYLEVALKAHALTQKHLAPSSGFLRRYAGGQAEYPAHLRDVAYHLKASLDLYDATFDPAHIVNARSIADRIISLHGPGDEGGGFYDTPAGTEVLLPRSKYFVDGALPSGNATLARSFLRLHVLTGESRYRTLAEGIIEDGIRALDRFPHASGELMLAALALISPVPEIAVAGDLRSPGTRAFLKPARHGRIPFSVIAVRPPGEAGVRAAEAIPFLKEKTMLDGRPTVYLCLNFVCKAPQNELTKYLVELDSTWRPEKKLSEPEAPKTPETKPKG